MLLGTNSISTLWRKQLNLILIIGILFCSSAYSFYEHTILSIYSETFDDKKDEMGKLTLDLDNEGTILALNQFSYEYGKVTESKKFMSEEIMTGKGAVLLVEEGREIVRLSSSTPEVDKYGGDMKISYLYNGIKNTRRVLYLKLKKLEGKWKLTDGDGKIVKSVKFLVNRLPVVGTVIGVERIKLNY